MLAWSLSFLSQALSPIQLRVRAVSGWGGILVIKQENELSQTTNPFTRNLKGATIMKRIVLATLSVLALTATATPALALSDRLEEARQQTMNKLNERFEQSHRDTLNKLSERQEQERQEVLNKLNDRFDKSYRDNLNSLNPRFEQEHKETLNALNDRFDQSYRDNLNS
jgi:DNA anti-recombination protein RmuC